MTKKPAVIIGTSYDGFAVTVNGKRWWINQEDDPASALYEIFETLGCSVEIEQEY